MWRLTLSSMLPIGLLALGMAGPACALPGQPRDEVTAWIKAHPTLQPAIGETLLVQKSDTPAKRFTFQASLLPPGRALPQGRGGIIRTETFSLFDMVNGVTLNRLEESLRVIYGPAVFQDYSQAQVVYAYPEQATLNAAQNRNTILRSALKGELRLGERFAYWIEIATNTNGVNFSGKFNVFLKEDLETLEIELRGR
ncbi:MAG: hypothetical protein F6K19_01190 [Cyanothece sp. SIO1E1]|nr:hypothetical protein [Cyanothece sp. SIO1E1]